MSLPKSLRTPLDPDDRAKVAIYRRGLRAGGAVAAVAVGHRAMTSPVRCPQCNADLNAQVRLQDAERLLRTTSVLLDQVADVLELAGAAGPVGLRKIRDLKARIDAALGLEGA